MKPATCTTCGSASADRLYATRPEGPACEHCLLDARKQIAGLAANPYESLVESLAAVLDLREHETGLHSKRVALNSALLARQFYSEADDLREIYWGSLLHDIGKIGVPDSILLKHKRLSSAEWAIMRQHPGHGYRILEKVPILALASKIVLCHEERYDGSGYPEGLKGEAIPLPARVFAVIDALDAMTFDRPYRRAMSFDAAKAEIVRMSGRQFDPVAVEAFLKAEPQLREISSLEYRLPELDVLAGG
ncbi:MAG: HD domain-containing protein [Betaproteobacteria bacterium]|nr:MAG: HD domain-containing protein [Betaproteobacteria bacterium]